MTSPGFDVDLVEWFTSNAATIDADLCRYFDGLDGDRFTGRWFDRYAAESDPSRFTAVDLVAVESLSVQVPPEAAAALLLLDDAAVFNGLLAQMPPNHIDLWEIDASQIGPTSPANELHGALCELPGIQWVTAGKLMAAKRPRLIPVYDNKVRELINPSDAPGWESLHRVLSDEGSRKVIEGVCHAGPEGVSLIRRMDVALWMAATQRPKPDADASH